MYICMYIYIYIYICRETLNPIQWCKYRAFVFMKFNVNVEINSRSFPPVRDGTSGNLVDCNMVCFASFTVEISVRDISPVGGGPSVSFVACTVPNIIRKENDHRKSQTPVIHHSLTCLLICMFSCCYACVCCFMYVFVCVRYFCSIHHPLTSKTVNPNNMPNNNHIYISLSIYIYI